MGRRHVLLAFLAVLPLTPPSARAQESGTFLGAGVHLARATMAVGGSDESATGLSLTAQAGITRSGVPRWILEVDAQTFRVPSPVLDESFRAFSGLVRLSLGSELFVAPGVGVQYRSWSGPERVEESDLGVALGASAGVRVPLEGWVLVPEVAFLWSSIELEGDVTARTLRIGASVLRPNR